ncbi:DUF1871 family protein [Ferdinandcohnia quinoae]|uniref:YugE family protein n=1 Tax=Fredinandcohnia quinoae TaxID=2918902 RepID=A0AAW5E9R8_9BACI|nr:DUF1871 family protein [Fredinandcohnia sp. SECRCQ15]MCH1625494.1 YugE family protein [Fredinandcohnia sp. SECRCQ15]
MEIRNTNIELMILLQEWDPFGHGEGSYETEAVDVIQAVHQLDDPKKLARKIQAIYEFSFEEIIPLNECEVIATRLLLIKNNASCEL